MFCAPGLFFFFFLRLNVVIMCCGCGLMCRRGEGGGGDILAPVNIWNSYLKPHTHVIVVL